MRYGHMRPPLSDRLQSNPAHPHYFIRIVILFLHPSMFLYQSMAFANSCTVFTEISRWVKAATARVMNVAPVMVVV